MSAAEVDELTERLKSDPAARSAVVRHFSLSCAVVEQLRETLYEESVVRELRRITAAGQRAGELSRRRSGLRLGLTITAALLVLVAFVGYRFDVHKLVREKLGRRTAVALEQLQPEVTATFGDVQLVAGDGLPAARLTKHDVLRLGQSIRTAKNSYATLRYADGTKLQLRGETQLLVEPARGGKQQTVRQGGLFAAVVPQPPGAPLVVNPHGYDRVEVVGTQFEFVRQTSGESIVRVAKGAVRFGAAEKAVEVAERQASTAAEDKPPAPPRPVEPATVWRGWEHGLRGDYYDWVGFGGKHFTRIDPQIDFHWGKATPAPEFNNKFAVRWTGQIEAPASGEFMFYTIAHYGIRLWVDGQQLIDSWASMGAEEDGRPIHLEKGRRYPIKIEYWDRYGDAEMRLFWRGPSMPKSIVDQRWLYPAINENGDSANK